MNELPFYFVFLGIVFFGCFDFFDCSRFVVYQRRAILFLQRWMILFLLACFALIRSVGVGSDDQAYLEIFSRVTPFYECLCGVCGYSYSDYNVEFGFFVLLSFVAALGSSQYWLFGVVAFISVYFNLKALRNFTPFLGYSCLVYFSHFYLAKELNSIRVGLASAVIFYAAWMLYQRRIFMMIILWLGAVLVHVSAFFFVIPMALYFFSPARWFLMLFAAFSVAASSVFSFKESLYVLSGLGFVGEKINLYLNADMYSYALPLFDLVNVKNILLMVASFLMWNRFIQVYRTFYFSFIFFYSASLFRVVFGDFAILAGRGYAAISMFEYVLVPFISVGIFGRRVGLLLVAGYALLMLWLNLNFNTGWSGGVEFFHDWR